MITLSRLCVAALIATLAVLPTWSHAQAPKPPATTTVPAPAAKTDPMDINTATKQQLMTLAGIGEARSDAIIKGRPYKAKNELADKNVIPQAVYDKIKDQIVAKQVAVTPPVKR